MLRKLGALKEGRDILRDEVSLNMIKVWLALEVRQLIHASVQDVCVFAMICFTGDTNHQIHALVRADMLSPNV